MTQETSAQAPKKVEKQYNADDLRTMKGLEAVREKPGMYIGGTDERALHHCINEVLDNSVDEFLAGHCSHIDVTIHSEARFRSRTTVAASRWTSTRTPACRAWK